MVVYKFYWTNQKWQAKIKIIFQNLDGKTKIEKLYETVLDKFLTKQM